MNEVTTADQHASTFQGRALAAPGMNMGAITVETERAIAEVQGQLTLAKRFPRSMVAAQMDFLEACKSPEFAATAFYAVKNRGSGPSIRFAEEAARCYGNFDYGHRELSRGGGKSEIEVYAWDKEKNNRSTRQITVEHIMDANDGARPLRNQTDIDNRIANVASKQMRGRILALVPKAMVAAGIAECKRTIAGGGEKPLSEKILGICKAFLAYGVNTDRLAKYLGNLVDQMTTDQYADLMGIGNALKEGGKASEFFPSDSAVDETQAPAAAAIAAAAKKPTAAAGKTSTATKDKGVASKPAETASNVVKDGVPQEEHKPAEAAAPATKPEQSQQPADITDEANAAAAAAGEEPDVF